MCDREGKMKQIAIVLCEKLEEAGISDDDLLKELEHLRCVTQTTLYDWDKVANYMIGLWANYAVNPKIPEKQKEEVNLLTHESVDALRELSKNKYFLENIYALMVQLIFRIKEKEF